MKSRFTLSAWQPAKQQISPTQLNQVLMDVGQNPAICSISRQYTFGRQNVLKALCVYCLKHEVFIVKAVFSPKHVFDVNFDLVLGVVGRQIYDLDTVWLRGESFKKELACLGNTQPENDGGNHKYDAPNVWRNIHFAPPKTIIDISIIGREVKEEVKKGSCALTAHRTTPVRARLMRANKLGQPGIGVKGIARIKDQELACGKSGMLGRREGLSVHVLLHYPAQVVVELAQFISFFAGHLKYALSIEGALLAVCVDRFKMQVLFANGVSFQEHAGDFDGVIAVIAANSPIENGNLAFTWRQVINFDSRMADNNVQPIGGCSDDNSNKNNGSNGHNKTRNAQNMRWSLTPKSKHLVKPNFGDLALPLGWPRNFKTDLGKVEHAFEKARELREAVA